MQTAGTPLVLGLISLGQIRPAPASCYLLLFVLLCGTLLTSDAAGELNVSARFGSLLEASGDDGHNETGRGVTNALVVHGSFCTNSESRTNVAIVYPEHGTLAFILPPTPHLHSQPQHLLAPGGWAAAVAVDLDADGLDEIVVARNTSVEVDNFAVLKFAGICSNKFDVHVSTVSAAPGSNWVSLADVEVASGDKFLVASRTGEPNQFVVLRSNLSVAATFSNSLFNESDRVLVARTGVAGQFAAVADGLRDIILTRITTDNRNETLTWNETMRGLSPASTTSMGPRWIAASSFESNVTAADQHASMVFVQVSPSENGQQLFLANLLASSIEVGALQELDFGRTWETALAAPWLDARTTQLIAVRRPNNTDAAKRFETRLLVYGTQAQFDVRRQRTVNMLAQYGRDALHFNLSSPLDLEKLTAALDNTHTNTYRTVVCPHKSSVSPHSYETFISLLQIASQKKWRIWLDLLPPTEAKATDDDCLVPPDSPHTEFNETSLFNQSLGYLDYAAWGELAGLLSVKFRALTVLTVDDFSHNMLGPAQAPNRSKRIFTPAVVAQMTGRMRRHNPSMSFIPVVYYREDGEFAWSRWSDLRGALDGILFPFRDSKLGPGPCANPRCQWGRKAKNATRASCCLAGACADSTVQNVAGEVADMYSVQPEGRQGGVHVAIYASGHSICGKPTANYVKAVLPLAYAQKGVDGVQVSRTVFPLVPCGQPAALTDEGCIVHGFFENVSHSLRGNTRHA